MGWGLSQEGPPGSCSIPVGDLPTAPLFGPDEGRVPGGRAAISFCQLSPVFTTDDRRFCYSLPLPLHLLCGDPGSARSPVAFAAQCGTRAPGVLGPALCGSPTASTSGACGLASHLRVASGCPHPTSPARAGPSWQDETGVPGEEAQPAAGRELLLQAVLLVSSAWAETPRRLRPVPELRLAGAEDRGSGRGSASRWLLVAVGSPHASRGGPCLRPLGEAAGRGSRNVKRDLVAGRRVSLPCSSLPSQPL